MNLALSFKTLTPEDGSLLHEWLQLPQVRAFWDDGLRTVAAVKDYYFQANGVLRFLFYLNEEAAGYIQTYHIGPEDLYAAFTLPAKENRGLDFFIGNEKFLNQGLAGLILKEFILKHCSGAARIIVDPEPRNKKAIHVYEKLGFRKLGGFKRGATWHDLMAIDL
jgi:RimJ/RimL family protein N-acetyltransferase